LLSGFRHEYFFVAYDNYLPWFRGEGLGFQELCPQLELQHMVAQRVPELNLPVEGAAVRLHLISAK
jgi:hypothetical protein